MIPGVSRAFQAAGDVVMILIDEQTHHAAEVALLRDLYLHLT